MGELSNMAAGTGATLSGVDPSAPGGLDELFAFHRGLFGDAVMENGGDGGNGGGDGGNGAGTGGEGGDGGNEGDPKPAQTFTQADVDKIVRDRLAQQAKNRFGDYDTLKSKAGEATTLEERVQAMEARTAAAETSALRSGIAAEYGISTKKGAKGESSDAELFLTGTDETTLRAQAQRLGVREADRKKHGNTAPREGETPNPSDSNSDTRTFVRGLFGRDD